MAILIAGLLLILFFIFVSIQGTALSVKKSVVLGFILRIFFVGISIGIINYDLQSYQIIGAVTRDGIPIYPELALFRYPYVPFFLYLQTLATFVKPYDIIFIKLVIVLFDTAIIYLLHLLTKKKQVPLLYAINPISIFISSIHGQFDAIPLFFLITAIYAFQKNRIVWSGLLYSLAVALKTWPIFFIFLFIKSLSLKNRFLFLALTISVPLLAVCIYSGIFKTPLNMIITTIRTYQPVFGVYGVGLVLKNVFGREDLYFVGIAEKLFLLSLFGLSFFTRKKTLPEELLFLLLFLLSFTPVFGIQWFMWVVPFILIVNPRGTVALLGIASLFLLVTYAGWGRFEDSLAIHLAGIAAWIASIYVFIRYTSPISVSSNVPSSAKSTK